jgi:hypothetical protein
MVKRDSFVTNLVLCTELAPETGCVIECGVWRGGMSAAMADMIPGRRHYLFDSFAGLPPAIAAVDGEAAVAFQRDKASPRYFDNCRAERSYAETVMRGCGAQEYQLVQGWFDETLKDFRPPEPIAVLRLDGDWYDSTIVPLTALFPHVMPGGLILIDDYYDWDGCARALHDYLSREQRRERVQVDRGVCYLVRLT